MLGQAPYEPLVSVLAATAGWHVAVANLPRDPSDPHEVLTAFGNAVCDSTDLLIAHSNAGYYLPALAQVRDIAAVAMDAALPTGDGTDTLLAPVELRDFLTGLPKDDAGRLPPWPEWWAREDVEPLYPDAASFERSVAAAPRLSMSYFTSRLPVPVGWATGRRAYLAFGQTYAVERAWATDSGWRVREVPGAHLEFLTDPGLVASELVALGAELGLPEPPRS